MPPFGAILVADDEPGLLSALCEGLAAGGYEVTGAPSGAEAVARMNERDFDVLLTDLMMPGMDGIELLDAALGIDPHVVGIVMTGQGTVQTAVEAMKSGAFDYVLKPFKIGTLLLVVARAMDVRRLRLENVQLRQTVAMYEMGKAISFTLDLNSILNKLVDAALEQCAADEASVMIPTDAGDELCVAAVRGKGRDRIMGERVAIPNGIAGWVARQREPVILQGAVCDPRFSPVAPRAEIRSSISLPMLVGGTLAGVLNVNATRMRRPFSLGDIKGLNILTSIAAPAMENCRLYGRVKDSEERYRFLFTNMLEGYAHCRVIYEDGVPGDFVYLDVNEAFGRLTGLCGVVGRRVTEVIPWIRESNPGIFEIYGRVASTGEPERFEMYIGPLNMWFSISVYCPKKGHCVAVFDVITERKQIEAALRQSEEKHRVLYESSRDAVMTLEPPSWKFTAGNPATVKLFGARDEREFVTKGPWDVSPERQPDGRLSSEQAAGMIVKAMDDGSNLFEWVHRRLDGADFPATVLFNRVELGGKRFLQATVRDVTDQKRLEGQLRQAQKMEAVGQLAGGVAHDFNNILSVIISYNGFLLEELPEGSPLKEDAAEVQKAARRAVDLTRQLLAFSRKQVIAPSEIAVNEAICNIDKMLRRLIGEHVSLELKLAPCAGVILMDRGQLDQIFINLAVNARDAMPGGGKLAIETEIVALDEGYTGTRPGMAPGEHVMIAVSDSGTGIPKEIQARIFDPFFTTKEKGKGTGLGLSMVYGAVKQNGGDVHLYSEPGRGTIFKLYFPRVAVVSAAAPARAVTRLAGKGERILVVEDEEQVRRALVRVLEKAGYAVVQATEAEGALALVESGQRYDLVITDVIMPGMGGVELGRRLAKSHPRLPVIYTSGYTDDMLGQQGILQPGVNIVVKPFEREVLLRRIRELLVADPHAEAREVIHERRRED